MDSIDVCNRVDDFGEPRGRRERLVSVNGRLMPESADKNAREDYFIVPQVNQSPGF